MTSVRAALAMAIVFAACGSADGPRGPAQAPAPPPEGPAPVPAPAADPGAAEARPIRRSRPLMGTIYEVSILGVDEARADAAAQAALNEIARLEDVLSEWRPETEISRVNAAAGGESIVIGPDTAAVVRAGLEVSGWSEGAFDLSWAALRGLYDFRPGRGRVPTAREVAPLLPLIDYRKVLLGTTPPTTMRLGQRGMAIGTGGIAKGYALDRAGAILEARGVESYMIFGGGQVQVHGLRGDRPWRVGIQHPRKNDYFAFLESSGGSISTSGDYEHFFVDARGRRWHHIIDTNTGLPVAHTSSVTILAETGIYADALSTACFVLGAERCLEMLARIPVRAEAVIVDADLRVHTTPGTDARMHWTVELRDRRLPN